MIRFLWDAHYCTFKYYYCDYLVLNWREQRKLIVFWKSLWRRLTWHLTASITTPPENLSNICCVGSRGEGQTRRPRIGFRGMFIIARPCIGRVVDVIHCHRPQSKIARIIALYHTHPPHHSNSVYSIPSTTDRANQYEFCFGRLLCYILLHLCGNLPPTSRTEEPPRNHDNSHPKEKSFVDNICSLLLV